jgi:large subunit ribosomal protein L29
MKAADIKNLSDVDLKDKLTEEKGTLARLKFNHSMSPVENPLEIRTKRRLIARINTEIRRRETEKAN